MTQPVCHLSRPAALGAALAGRRALITGGSRGIAGAIARTFAANGARIALNYCAEADARAGFPDAARQMLDAIVQNGTEAVGVEGDLTQPGTAAALAERAISSLGGIDIVVLSASVQIHKDFLLQTDADIALQLQINLVANIQILQRLIPVMRQTGWGRIIAIGSVQEDAPSGEMPIYSLTKSAQENLVRNLAVQNAPYGITANNIAPGLIETDRNAFRRRDPAVWEALSANANPMRRAGQPDDIVGAALFLASEASAFVTGATIHATGGAHIPWARPDFRGPGATGS
jgi:NAD(P)-dependent dehydrogenase (short-subunit alcohol dehydrogenase family)